MTNPFTARDYERFQGLVLERTGLHFGDSKARDLAVHLDAAFEETGIDEVSTYYARLRAASLDNELWVDLINRLIVNETFFFRNAPQFAALRDFILPSLIRSRRESNQLFLRLWCAGCATGEEPYSLAILLYEALPDISQWNIMLMATDINRHSLAYAAKGVYGDRSFRSETPSYVRKRYFRTNGRTAELMLEIRQMVRFSYHNLAEDNYPSVANNTLGLDLIMCRNVTIYFPQDTTRRIVQRFRESLVEDGWLIVGHSEPHISLYAGFEVRNFEATVIYQKAPKSEAKEPIIWWTNEPATPPHANLSGPASVRQPSTASSSKRRASPAKKKIATQTAPAKEPPSPNAAVLSYLEKAREFANRMQWPEAHQWLDRALEQEPLLLEAHFLRALIYNHQGDNKQALEALRRAIYIDRHFVLGHFHSGMINWQLGRVREARRAWGIARILLQQMQPQELLPHSDGMSAGYLLPILADYLERVGQDGH